MVWLRYIHPGPPGALPWVGEDRAHTVGIGVHHAELGLGVEAILRSSALLGVEFRPP